MPGSGARASARFNVRWARNVDLFLRVYIASHRLFDLGILVIVSGWQFGIARFLLRVLPLRGLTFEVD